MPTVPCGFGNWCPDKICFHVPLAALALFASKDEESSTGSQVNIDSTGYYGFCDQCPNKIWSCLSVTTEIRGIWQAQQGSNKTSYSTRLTLPNWLGGQHPSEIWFYVPLTAVIVCSPRVKKSATKSNANNEEVRVFEWCNQCPCDFWFYLSVTTEIWCVKQAQRGSIEMSLTGWILSSVFGRMAVLIVVDQSILYIVSRKWVRQKHVILLDEFCVVGPNKVCFRSKNSYRTVLSSCSIPIELALHLSRRLSPISVKEIWFHLLVTNIV